MHKDDIAEAPLSMVEFNQKLRQEDKSAWMWLQLNAKSYFRHWSNDEKIEIMWTTENNKPHRSVDSVHASIITQIKMDYKDNKPDFGSVSDFKEYIRKIFDAYITVGFKSFVQCLKKKISVVWTMFYQRMYRLLIIKVYMKQKMSAEDSHGICTDSLTTFSDKIQQTDVDFENSKVLKSFVYRINDFKLQEYFREVSKRNRNDNIDEIGDRAEFEETTNTPDNKDDQDFVELLLGKLEKIEYDILVKYFFYGLELKEIAAEMNKTPENIRIIKYRAIEKLRGYLVSSN